MLHATPSPGLGRMSTTRSAGPDRPIKIGFRPGRTLMPRQGTGAKGVSAVGIQPKLIPHGGFGHASTDVLFETIREGDQQIVDTLFFDNLR